jgi:hypothetical protein
MPWLVLIAALFIAAPAEARDYCRGSLCFQKKARTACLKPEVWSILHQVTARFGKIEVTSGCDGRRSPRSLHHSGRAVDFRPMEASPRAVIAYVRSLPGVGGVGSYANGLVHADVGNLKMSWQGHGKSRRYTLRAKSRYAMQRPKARYASAGAR